MNVLRHHERLAAEYVLGTLHGPARARFSQLLREDTALQDCTGFWESALTTMASPLSAVPSTKVWHAIAARVATREHVEPSHWIERWFGLRTLAPLAGGLFVGIALGVMGPSVLDRGVADGDATQLPESYVGVLAGTDGRAGLIVSSRRRGTVMDLKQIQAVAVDASHTLFLWAIEGNGTTHAIGPVPQGRFVQLQLAQPSEQLLAKATELAVSVEVIGSAPATPVGPFVYRGLCGKLWRAPAAKN